MRLVRESKTLRVSHFAAVWQLHSITGIEVEQPEQEPLPALAARAADIAGGSEPHRGEAARQILQSIVDGEQTLQPPSVITNPRGRPRGALGRRRRDDEPMSSTRRDISLHEHAEAEAAGPSGRRCGQCGGQGHNRRTCPQRRPDAQSTQMTGEGDSDRLDHDQANRELVSFRQEWLAEISDLQTETGPRVENL